MNPPDIPLAPAFERELLIRFSHCDPAGIVFFPQYMVMFNNLVEDWVNEGLRDAGLRLSYAAMISTRRIGMPTVSLKCDFKVVSRLGDLVALQLAPAHIGRSSLRLNLACVDAGNKAVERVRLEQVIVFTDLTTHRPVAIPDDMREAMLAFQTH